MHCGVAGEVDCCASPWIPGGTFDRLNDPRFPATVSTFRLDAFEVTVGRFRAFVDAWPQSRPKAGDGARRSDVTTGWSAAWDAGLPASKAELRKAIACDFAAVGAPDPYAHWADRTWTDAVGPNERMPMSCVGWHLAFAFCAWDRARLPTEAEQLYARAGGSEQRPFPWGNAVVSDERAVLRTTVKGSQLPVGSRPSGNGRWGHADLVGARWEYLVDRGGSSVYPIPLDFIVPCRDCVDARPDDDFVRRISGFGFDSDPTSVSAKPPERGYLMYPQGAGETTQSGLDLDGTVESVGFRCARDVEL